MRATLGLVAIGLPLRRVAGEFSCGFFFMVGSFSLSYHEKANRINVLTLEKTC
jgi:hypothetical protein